MKIQFNINYFTQPGQEICILGSEKEIGNWNTNKAIPLEYKEDGNWTCTIDIKSANKEIEYQYLLREFGDYEKEWGNPRVLPLNAANKKVDLLVLSETWRAPSKEERALYSAAFTKVLLKADDKLKGAKSSANKVLEFKINIPRIGTGYQVCVLGDHEKLGNWDKENVLFLSSQANSTLWSGSIPLSGDERRLRYKYGIYDLENKLVKTIEEGFDRELYLDKMDKTFKVIRFDESFRYPIGHWKGAGVSVPVFSLRSDHGFGVGEFTDLVPFIEWSKSVGLKMVQILPVNETIASHDWLDSYPYKSISVMALHPIYLNLDKMGILKDMNLVTEFSRIKRKLNKEDHVNYPEVIKHKSRYFKYLYEQEKDRFFDKKEYKEFFKKNKDWLEPYAAFAFLRDQNKCANFRKWDSHSKYNKKNISKLCSSKSPYWDEIAIHYFIQFHLDKQLGEVTSFARSNKVVLKGDIPIGISPNSVEAWTEPHLFNLNGQAGAPPDDFAIKGQNWGFPTYNWDAMSKEGYDWWKKRLRQMGQFFDAYRIDHILGFFRIWEIPDHAVEGIMGHFKPCLPLSADEIRSYGIYFDSDRISKPYIRKHVVEGIFHDKTNFVLEHFLQDAGDGFFKLKKAFETQKKVNAYFLKNTDEEHLNEEKTILRDGLFDLISNVLFIQLGEDQWHPRVAFHQLSTYQDLDHYTKERMNDLYVQFYYKRHNDFWYHKGMEKLPVIMSASDMLVCGEDLGMVPDCVPPVMDALNILTLEIQRMPKDPGMRFLHPSNAPYLSVCTTSTHDMSTIRGWWEEDREQIQNFHNQLLGNGGEAPYFAEPWICRQIIAQHLHSSAMWVTIPIQDYIGMDGHLRWKETHEEQINEPSNVRHHWKYRMVQTLDDLFEADEFNKLLSEKIDEAGRNSDY